MRCCVSSRFAERDVVQPVGIEEVRETERCDGGKNQEGVMGRKSNSKATLPAASHSGVAAGYEDFFNAAMRSSSISVYCWSDVSYDFAYSSFDRLPLPPHLPS